MKLLRQFGIILLIVFVGDGIQRLFKLAIPGSVIGMMMLFIGLSTGFVKLNMVEKASKALLDHLSFFFIPAGVGLISYLGILKSDGIAIVAISVITTIMVMVITGYTVQMMKRRNKK
jgi:holin-like protein